jgi:hypothetical protein
MRGSRDRSPVLDWLVAHLHDAPADDACVEWPYARNSKGYGNLRIEGKNIGVPRVVWTRVKGPIPVGLDVLHTCDNPPCFRLSHLFVGNKSQNMQDCIAKGRFRAPGSPGEKHPNHLLTEHQVLEIRDLRGLTVAEIAARFNVTKSCVSHILNFHTWRHLSRDAHAA